MEILQRLEDQLTEYGEYGTITDLKCYRKLLCSETEGGEKGGEENRRNFEENKNLFILIYQKCVKIEFHCYFNLHVFDY